MVCGGVECGGNVCVCVGCVWWEGLCVTVGGCVWWEFVHMSVSEHE